MDSMSERNDNATPTIERCVTSYPARRAYRPGVVYPPKVPGVKNAIDIHCHAHEGQQDALALAQLASESGMKGILYKTIGTIAGEYKPWEAMRKVNEDLRRWADEEEIEPIECWAGYGVTMDNKPPSVEKLRRNLDEGVKGVWLPVFNSANTYNRIGAKTRWIDPKAGPNDHTAPMSWEDAMKHGEYLLDGQGRLKPLYDEMVRMVADRNVALFFGHTTHQETYALAELVDKLGFKRAVIDHPFSPFVDLDVQQMKDLARIGIWMNFTYDEISPLLGVDPKKMYDAIRAVGPEHVTLSSDAGEPLFPHSVECMRLMGAYMEAFGLKPAELEMVLSTNPARLVQ